MKNINFPMNYKDSHIIPKFKIKFLDMFLLLTFFKLFCLQEEQEFCLDTSKTLVGGRSQTK